MRGDRLQASIGVRLAAVLVAAMVAVGPARSEVWQPFGAEPDASLSGGPPMRLGLHADRWSGEEAAPKALKSEQQCRKWRAMAHHLGETFAGYTLRQGVLKRVCAFAVERAEDAWDWPWAGIAQGRLPPRQHKSFAAWEICCGSAGARRRCALIHTAVPALPLAGELHPSVASGVPVVTHFVIDMVGGRESVLWRVFVPSDGAAAADVNTDSPRVAAVAPARTQTRTIRYRVGAADYVERYSTCVEQGCMMEAHIGRAGEVATRLWDGTGIDLELTLTSGRDATVRLPARGFRAALAELMRLRREELKAGRR